MHLGDWDRLGLDMPDGRMVCGVTIARKQSRRTRVLGEAEGKIEESIDNLVGDASENW